MSARDVREQAEVLVRAWEGGFFDAFAERWGWQKRGSAWWSRSDRGAEAERQPDRRRHRPLARPRAAPALGTAVVSLEAWEQADALGRAVEGGAFDEAGLSYKLGRALHSKGRPPASMLDEENLHLRAVERFLGERLKSNVFGYLYTRFNGYKDLIGNYAKPGALEGWWAMLAASRAQDRRREHELTLRAKKRREVAARREREGFSRRWRRER